MPGRGGKTERQTEALKSKSPPRNLLSGAGGGAPSPWGEGGRGRGRWDLLQHDQRHAPVDVFYVHPTSYVGARWNGPVDDPALNEATDRVATRIQASAFNGCCAVWAPRYRQANGTPIVTVRRGLTAC